MRTTLLIIGMLCILTGMYFITDAVTILGSAKSAIHQILGYLSITIASIFFTGGAIICSINK